MTTLTDGTTTVTLPADMVWSDEFTWTAVEQSTARTITGGMVVSVAARLAGRPITLSSADAGSGWLTRDALLQCYAWASVPGQQLTLNLRGANRTVMFRVQDGAIQDNPVADFTDVDATDYYTATLRFMEV